MSLAEDNLLRQIWEEPEDRERLSVYADWLLQHGDATRGEYMQLALLDKPTKAQEKRQETLRKKHRGAWLGAARPYVYTWEESFTSPGFISRVTCNVDKLANGLEHIVDLGPRLMVNLGPVTTAAGRKRLGSIALGSLYGLGLYESDLMWVNDRLLDTIIGKLDDLRRIELFVFPDRFSLTSWRKVLELPALQELQFHCFGSPDEYLVELTTKKDLPPRLHIVELARPESAALARALTKEFKGRYLKFGH